MAVTPSPFGPKPQYVDTAGEPAVGYQLFFYVAGSNTKQNTYTDSTGGTPNANPIILNALGEPTTQIWFDTSLIYKVVLAPPTDTDPPTSPVWTIDNLQGMGTGSGTSSTQDEWILYSAAPTFVSSTSFSVAGNQTAIFQGGRRIKASVTGGTLIYGTVLSSSFGAVTTVVITPDSTGLDAGLTAVYYGLLNSQNRSLPTTAITIRGFISGLVPSTAGGSITITTSAGQAADGTNAEVMTLPTAISKTTFNWSVGSGNGGLDTGGTAPLTAYYLWLIKRPDTGVVDVLISLSATSPTMPSGYTLKRLIGYGRTDAGAAWVSFTAVETAGGGLDWVWAAPTLDLNTAVLTTSRLLTTLTVPALVVTANLQMTSSNAGTPFVKTQCPDETDAAPSGSASPGADFTLAAAVSQTMSKVVRTNSSGQVASRSTAAATTLRLITNGFTWPRR